MDETVLWQLSYGMYAIGAKHGAEDKGCIVNTIVQITAENPIIAVSMNKDNYTYEVIRESGQFAVSILGEEVDNNVIAELGFSSGRTKEKFKLFAAGHTKEGLPIVEQGAVGYLTCEVLQIIHDPLTVHIQLQRHIFIKAARKLLLRNLPAAVHNNLITHLFYPLCTDSLCRLFLYICYFRKALIFAKILYDVVFNTM